MDVLRFMPEKGCWIILQYLYFEAIDQATWREIYSCIWAWISSPGTIDCLTTLENSIETFSWSKSEAKHVTMIWQP